jgi:hypothetical protein
MVFELGETVVYLAELATVVELPRRDKKGELREKPAEVEYRIRFGAPIRLEWVRADLIRRPPNRL